MAQSNGKRITKLTAEIEAERRVLGEYKMFDSPKLSALVAQREALMRIDRRAGKVRASR